VDVSSIQAATDCKTFTIGITMSNIVQQSVSTLLDAWIKAEQNGVKFPVPFDVAWPIAGYGRKSTAKRDGLKGLKEGLEYIVVKGNSSDRKEMGRPSEAILLTVKAFEFMQNRLAYKRKPANQSKKVYVMQCSETSVIKIGISCDPSTRLATIQTGYPFKLNIVRVINSRKMTAAKLESSLHKALDDFRLNGEWFDGLALCMIGA
jgi:hypothetical protein